MYILFFFFSFRSFSVSLTRPYIFSRTIEIERQIEIEREREKREKEKGEFAIFFSFFQFSNSIHGYTYSLVYGSMAKLMWFFSPFFSRGWRRTYTNRFLSTTLSLSLSLSFFDAASMRKHRRVTATLCILFAEIDVHRNLPDNSVHHSHNHSGIRVVRR